MTYLDIISYIIIPIMSVMIIPAVRSIYLRVHALEQVMLTKVTDSQVRQLLTDKIDPVQEDLKEIKGQLSQIINRLIENK